MFEAPIVITGSERQKP